jgi:hypothetical protein
VTADSDTVTGDSGNRLESGHVKSERSVTINRNGRSSWIGIRIAHLWFEVIHPFDDGKGRVGRAMVASRFDSGRLLLDLSEKGIYPLSHTLINFIDPKWTAVQLCHWKRIIRPS